MEITVSVKCSDQVIRVKYVDLLKYSFFQMQLSNLNTRMTYQMETITLADGGIQTLDHYIIPQLNVECKSTILLKLLHPKEFDFSHEKERIKKYSSSPLFQLRARADYEIKYPIKPGEYDEDFLELILYNNMYEFNHLIDTYNYNNFWNEYLDLPLYIKQKFPRVNVFNFLQNHRIVNLFINHYFELSSNGQMEANMQVLIPDLLEYIDYGLWGVDHLDFYSAYLKKSNLQTLSSLKYFHQLGFINLIHQHINPDKIKRLLQLIIEGHKCGCTSDHIRDYHQTNIEQFNKFLSKIFVILGELDKLGIIKLADVGPIETYQVYNHLLTKMN